MENNNFFGWVVWLTSVLVIAFLVNAFISSKVPAGYEAILVNSYGQQWVQDSPLVTGRVYYNPFTQDLIRYPVFVQTKDYDAFEVPAKDGSKFTVDPTISYRIEAWTTPIIYSKYRKDIDQITDVIILQIIKDTFRVVLNKYTADDMISKAGEIDSELYKYLSETTKSEHISIERLTSGLKYPETLTDAIANKNKAVQDAQRVENELRVAEANAKIKQTNAEAEAKAKITEAEASAKAIEIQSKAIQSQGGDDYIRLQWIEKVGSRWWGVLPQTTLGSDMNLFLNMAK